LKENKKEAYLQSEKNKRGNRTGVNNKWINLLDTSQPKIQQKLFSEDGDNSLIKANSPVKKKIIKIEVQEETTKETEGNLLDKISNMKESNIRLHESIDLSMHYNKDLKKKNKGLSNNTSKNLFESNTENESSSQSLFSSK